MPTRTDRNQTFDSQGNLLDEEVLEVDVTERVRRDAILSRARQAIDRLQQIESQAAIRTDASNLAEANQQLQGLANAAGDVARMLRYVLVLDVVPDLLGDADAAGDLD